MERQVLEELTDAAAPEISGPQWALHGRTAQVGRVEQLMRDGAEHQRAHVVVLESGAGTGKTRLLLELMSVAARRGFAVVNGAAEPPGLARAVSLVTPRGGRQEDERVGVAAGRFEAQLTSHLRRRPVLVAVDDAQWADLTLLHALGAVMSKLDKAPVLWLFAVHADHADSPSGSALRTLARKHRTEWLGPLEPLTGAAVAGIAGDLLDAAPSDDLVALCDSVGGTPQAVVDLVLDLRRDGCLTVADQVARLVGGPLATGISAAVEPDPGAPLPRPFTLRMQARLRELSTRAQEVLQVAAVLGHSFAPQDLAEMLGQRPAQLLGPLQEALAAGLIGSDADEFVFHREPVWRAVLGTVPELLRSMLHRQAATMLLGRPRHRAEAAAVHLVHCAGPGDTAAVGTIREAAHRLLATSPQAASALATRGLRIAAPDSGDHVALATTATAALVRLGCLSDAVDLAQEQLAAHADAEPELARPLRTWLATALMLRGDTSAAFDVSNHAVAATGQAGPGAEPCPEPCPELLLLNALSHNDQGKVALIAERVLDQPGRHSDDVRAAALNVRAMSHWREGRLEAAIDTVDEAVRLRGRLTRAWQCDPLWTRAWLFTKVRRLDEALAAAETARAAIDTEHNGVLSPVPLALRATVLLAKGELVAAESDARAGLTASERAEMPLYEPQLRAVLVISALRRGDLALAADSLRRLEECAPAERAQPWSALVRVLAAVVVSARRGAHAAMDELRESLADSEQCRQLLLEDPSMAAWAVRTALSAGERDSAGNVVAAAEEIAAANPSFDTVAAAARHGRALLDNDVTALHGLESGYGDPWAAASVVEDTGTLLREQDRDRAITELNRAMAAYDALGAEWDSARVRRKLRRLGVRRRHWNHEARPETGWDSLTSTEAKVARLVAQGLTNRQVASEMFVSPHTVGFHLRQIYRKLSIQSRVDLARIAP
ncbi:LuxR family transcriptional regulator [Nocardia sp. NRRL S-836]|uniref:helix-turn-helix transcriptional regulator n=1 Tax=Nocardia sp. NRRL S-836 TaxID=1519492 RepID=UPI0006AE4ABD|nr:LuxR family transcriptional regulator [Nocardia sp. NRRL S-836]KOV85186.1 hypothetical protein ADL03_13250 [Nocardia sp. NRRL S-836]